MEENYFMGLVGVALGIVVVVMIFRAIFKKYSLSLPLKQKIPLKAIFGWMFKDKEMLKTIDYIENDIDRLNKIASRFGKVGSTIKLQPVVLHELIKETIDFFNRKLPSFSKKITIEFDSRIEGKEIELDPDLIKWTIENLENNWKIGQNILQLALLTYHPHYQIPLKEML